MNAAAGLSSHGLAVLYSSDAALFFNDMGVGAPYLAQPRRCMLMPRLDCLVTAWLSCSVTAMYVNAAAGLSSHGAFVLFSQGAVC